MKKSSIVVVDNGAATIKLGVVHGKAKVTTRIIQNAIVRSKGDKITYVGQEIDSCNDFSSLRYRLPFEKGYLADWDAQKAIWDDIFTSQYLGVAPSDASLLITEPYFNLPNLQDVYDQFIFEEYEFQSYYRCTPASMIPHSNLFQDESQPPPECMLVIDSGFSYTHVVPINNGLIVWPAVRRRFYLNFVPIVLLILWIRIDVGGKLLTNQLKELVSYRQWNMMDETYVMNDVKESCCYVSANFKQDLEMCRNNPKTNPIVREYVLPDFSSNKRGHVRTNDEILADSSQILHMNNERFSVPELLFRPDDIGLEQAGLAATIADSISTLPEELRGMFWANIGLIGGTTKFPSFCDRLSAELRSLAPVDCEVKIYEGSEPILEAYNGALAFARVPSFFDYVVTREEYLEMGSNASRRKFRDWKPAERGSKGKEVSRSKTSGQKRDEDEEDEDEDGPPKKAGRGRGRGRGSYRKRG
ncbi:actin-like protein Arp6 [Irpex rosettiformis]|uniref:Actin-like protein Arp6 n=1 Tax=Irpex rosettiformis TaxID=378272 RepID=A0ACB8TYE7_9APHY|nr:actin-like protein Arp6 [Irpex rosettiformis]